MIKESFPDPTHHRFSTFPMNMSMDISADQRVCYVHCNFCNTILAVSVPCSNIFSIVTVRCGHCANLLSANVGASVQAVPFHRDLLQLQRQQHLNPQLSESKGSGSSSTCNKYAPLQSLDSEQPRLPPIRPPEKRQRVPSAYNKFIKEEIQRIKASNPEIRHREAFSMAAKNWAHFPDIHFGLNIDGQKQSKFEQTIAGEGTQKHLAI
ncbi:hypothetical protein Nepgr_000233 [Nepenthes gracilis]|uniref:Uncharacterized protein n=1 Tax=Nepenthes gracilis TaxID=150966 RepID=A0AAD3P2Q5_NEPGR|nr:hypothetical protein Nepgr_000233 [Nepenthes gracilis]